MSEQASKTPWFLGKKKKPILLGMAFFSADLL
jgi:hypothetical protein